MAKIYEKEYQILKSLDDKWKWLARDKNSKKSTFPNELWLYEYKPIKGFNHWLGGGGATERFRYNNLFQFIKWRDKEPCNIAELIEEYEKDYKGSWEHAIEFSGEVFGDSEETEVKDLEWLKEKVQKRIDKLPRAYSGLYIDGSRDAYHLALQDINQLDNQEVLSEKWIDEHKWVAKDTKTGVTDYAVADYDLQNLLVPKQEEITESFIETVRELIETSELAMDVRKLTGMTLEEIKEEARNGGFVVKQELPKVPQYVANKLEQCKADGIYSVAVIFYGALNREYDETLNNWILNNQKLFTEAFFAYPNIEVEEEQKYYVSERDEEYGGFWHLFKNNNGGISIGVSRDGSEVDWDRSKLTEQEIKEYDERYWAFAKPVEEIEE